MAIFALAVAGLIAFGAGQASANHVSCGDEITADTALDSDLVNCANNGIVIGADDITLDLNGHRIDGDGTESPGCDPKTEPCDFGIANEGHDGVTVRDGSVREFGIGVLVGGARENRVLNISSSSHDSFGAAVGGSSRSVIRGGSFSRNIAPEGDGIGLFGSDHIRIVGNQIRRNPGPGIHVFDSTENLIKGNRFARNDIFLEGNRNRVTGNRSVRADLGINVSGNRNVIAQIASRDRWVASASRRDAATWSPATSSFALAGTASRFSAVPTTPSAVIGSEEAATMGSGSIGKTTASS